MNKKTLTALTALGCLAGTAANADIEWAGGGKHRLAIILDARAGWTGRQVASREKGIGLLRLSGKDRNNDGIGESRRGQVYLGQLGLEFTGRFGQKTSYLVEVNSQLDETERTAVNIPEVWLARETRIGSADAKFRAGFLIPHFSMEHPGQAWSTFFTLTPSAVNSWIGEEVRGWGLEGQAKWRMAQTKKASLTLASFQGADTSGLLLSWRGWAMHDRQAGINDRIPFKGNAFLTSPGFFGQTYTVTRPFQEMDDQWGYYGMANLETKRARFNYGHWDNRTDTRQIDKEKALGWHTRFQHIGARFEPVDRRYMIQGQLMWGNTKAGASRPARMDNDFTAFYLMYSEPVHGGRFTARFDKFWINEGDIYRNFDPNEQDGFAVTAAFVRPIAKNQELVAELVTLRSKRQGNVLLGGRPNMREWQGQLAWRYFP